MTVTVLKRAHSHLEPLAMLKRFVRHPASQALFARLLGLYLAFALRTTRWTLVGGEHLKPHALGQPAIMTAWHERLPLLPALWLTIARWKPTAERKPRIHILVSRSRDGLFIAGIVRRFGIEVELGSTSHGGAAGARELLRVLAAGDHVGITPDGPRGPWRHAASGVARVAALSGAPVLPCSAQTSARWTLRTRDHMVIPRPFGRGVIVCGAPISIPRDGWQDFTPAIEAALNEVADRADRLCGVEPA
jgi:lysophospholipid acyltransferase (LPLAT)-like uncharacterized protein